MNRGFYDRYTTESILVAAKANSKSIDKEMAEAMHSERERLIKPDMVMVPCADSVTGWKYVRRD